MSLGGSEKIVRSNRLFLAYARHFLVGDLLVATALAGILIISFVNIIPAVSVPASSRVLLYSTGAVIAASLAGFSLVAITVILDASSSPALKLLRKSEHFPKVFDTLLSSVRFLGLTTFALILALIAAGGSTWEFILVVFSVWLVLISVARIGRTLWILSNVLRLAAQQVS